MGTNIAILIGVSDYKFEPQLPACAADVTDLGKLLTATKKYSEVLSVTSGTDSATLKTIVRSFFSKYQDEDMNEVFVYFSGHGTYQNGDALLCCSDFDYKQPSTTSISNSEIDDLLRSVSPVVAVKVIDACQSGSPYIKDVGAGFEKALRTSTLNSFICMASSRQDQLSYASSDASDFTAKWIDSALRQIDGEVMYRDIQAGLADAFVDNEDQTPFFVVQGTGLEAFSAVTEEMKKLKAQRSSNKGSQKLLGGIQDKVAAAIDQLEAMFVTQDQAGEAVIKAGQRAAEDDSKDELAKHFYTKSVDTEGTLQRLPRARVVAEFALEQGWTKNYFVKVNEAGKVVKSESGRATSIVKVPTGIEATEQLPIEIIRISYEPRAQALKAFDLYIGLVHSVENLMVLSAVVELTAKGWNDRRPDLSQLKWRYQSLSWGSVVALPDLVWRDAVSNAEGHIRSYLEGLAPRTDDDVQA